MKPAERPSPSRGRTPLGSASLGAASADGAIVLFGGPSRERLVSVASAQAVVEALDALRCWFWAADGPVFETSTRALLAHAQPFEVEFTPVGSPRWPDLKTALATFPYGAVLVVALHGHVGEDGTLQAWLEERGIPFTGSGSAASRDAFDKERAREICARAGLRVAEARVLRADQPARTRAHTRELLEQAGRIVVKPVAEGSSFGLRVVASDAELDAVLETLAAEPGRPYLAEAFVEGVELTVAAIEHDGALQALPCSEVRVSPGRSFGYTEKYLGKGAREVTPAEIPPDMSTAAQFVALEAHRALGCAGYSRTDVIVDAAGPVFLETNTLPGLTRASFLPQQLAAAGIPFRSFLDEQIELALRRAGTR